MTLTYRGICYQTSNLTVNTQKTQVTGIYRGQSYQLSGGLQVVSKPARNLTYRGVKYDNSTVNSSTSIPRDLQPVFN